MLFVIEVKVRLFGAFRKYGDGREIVLELPERSGLSELRSALAACLAENYPEFDEARLLEESAFADETAILASGARFEKNCSVAVLPPVCGG